jgi:ubiquitin carboxyl-terminal hydrolase 25/28
LEKYAAGSLEPQEPDGTTANIDDEMLSAPDENWDFDGSNDEDFFLITPSTLASSDQPATRRPYSAPLNIRETDAALRNMMETELQKREQTLKEHQESLVGIPYRLHAVICHRGHLMSGHYWVWIHDFEENTWRWYNDADVKENKDTAEVLQTLSTSGEPYYLCYVRDEDKAEYVNTPKRQQPTPSSEPQDTPASEMMTDKDGDVDAVAEVLAPTAEGNQRSAQETGLIDSQGGGDSQLMQE